MTEKDRISRKNLVPFECLLCGVVFQARSDKIRIGQTKYCSRSCSGKAGSQIFHKDKVPKENLTHSKPRIKSAAPKTRAEINRRKKLLERQRYPEKFKARIIAQRALRRRNKSADKSCEKCGDKEVQMHHDDYSKPLEVRWLCRKHHNEEHRGA
jgi:predicted RNA-binding Zn-ribbon protein involved in translation (DUF1610 family)